MGLFAKKSKRHGGQANYKHQITNSKRETKGLKIGICNLFGPPAGGLNLEFQPLVFNGKFMTSLK
ncbi:MAG: hypothetical protein A3J65_04655 [Candidatus Buchananbacteria bacterium RIFCSPHIGHO2_02_FULL_45_11b]|uniref:Uncharacterized protein n=2 Tax=Candidatus Buchananiibacteriota TaxID=1817903 RepID=A0A1G1YD66_9BACT|nr:MAG: hypothetical protein A3J65_04655 [Candidatus Buchananbacteria bacterium RIFCSPHIGHO2_02_FULL_45_11b]OGY58051.1 MAG: hypothetical protein A3H67_01115 [Candidatus Buchananbacteria bacterium RIFCSPLOWO2_02_FULL_46_11b]